MLTVNRVARASRLMLGQVQWRNHLTIIRQQWQPTPEVEAKPKALTRPQRPSLRDALKHIESLGVTHIVTETDMGRKVVAVNEQGVHQEGTRILNGYTFYLCASLADKSGLHITLSEARRILGFSGATYIPATPTGLLRERLMMECGWPAGRALTLEELEAR